MLIESIKNSFTLLFDSWSTDRKTVDTLLEDQDDIRSVKKNSPKYLIVAHRTAARTRVPSKAKNVSTFDNSDVRKYHVDIDGTRYPREGVSFDYGINDYIDRYRDLKLFYKEYVGEKLLNPFVSYTDMKKNS